MDSKEAASLSIIVFELAGTAYAVPSQSVQQIEMIEHVTPVPNAPSFVDGVVFVRGQVVPVVNLRARFGFERAPYDLKTRLIVIAHGGRTVGLLVDTARDFVTIEAASINPPPEAITGLSGKYLQGVVITGERIILLLDIDELLAFQDLPAAVDAV
jgi:purine-binding chemotaxis protein CheW